MKKLFTLFFILVTFTSNAQIDCAPATITNVEREGTGNRITWTMPAGEEEIEITQSETCKFNAIGNNISFGVYHRFTPENLSTINGGELIQIIFVPMFFSYQIYPGHTYTIQIYQGGKWGVAGERNPGTLISSQELNNNNLLFNQENTITLENHVTIDASHELWIGYYCTNIDSVQTVKSPAGSDSGPCKEGFGNVMFYNNEWNTFYEISSIDFNWCIKGIVKKTEGESINIYFNENIIDNNVSGTNYFHNNPESDKHCYKVEVNCFEGGISLLSNEICIEWNNINEQNLKIGIYPNPARNELRIMNYELRNGLQSEVEVEIYDIYGRKQSNGSRVTSHEITIDVSHLSAGVYLLKLIDGQNSYMQRFIKH
jgi:hypothetical protein